MIGRLQSLYLIIWKSTTYHDSISKDLDLEPKEIQQLMLNKLAWRKFVTAASNISSKDDWWWCVYYNIPNWSWSIFINTLQNCFMWSTHWIHSLIILNYSLYKYCYPVGCSSQEFRWFLGAQSHHPSEAADVWMGQWLPGIVHWKVSVKPLFHFLLKWWVGGGGIQTQGYICLMMTNPVNLLSCKTLEFSATLFCELSMWTFLWEFNFRIPK